MICVHCTEKGNYEVFLLQYTLLLLYLNFMEGSAEGDGSKVLCSQNTLL